jgi:phosphate transporter
MVSGHRGGQQGIFRSVEQDDAAFELKGDGQAGSWGSVIGMKGMTFIFALVVLATVVAVQPFARVEESNCLAMLLFCTILWATEVSLVTSPHLHC